MTLAEALSIRKDLQMRIKQLRERLINNVRVQEGEMPYEQPEELMKELDSCLNQWQKWIYNINVTNMHTIYRNAIVVPSYIVINNQASISIYIA